jgi:hypothetical protein
MAEQWGQFIQNPKGVALKKFMAQILEQKVIKYDDFLSRMGAALVTDNDVRQFADLINDVVMFGYLRAEKEYKEKLAHLGIQLVRDQEKLG